MNGEIEILVQDRRTDQPTKLAQGEGYFIPAGYWYSLRSSSGASRTAALRFTYHVLGVKVTYQDFQDPVKRNSVLPVYFPQNSPRPPFHLLLFSQFEPSWRKEGAAALTKKASDLLASVWDQLKTDAEQDGKTPRNHGVLDQARNLIALNCRHPIRRKEIARGLGISESYLTVLVREKLGLNVTELMVLIRLEIACQFLVSSSIRISQISEISGFRSPNYFIRVFRKLKGMTPLQYRKLTEQDHLTKEDFVSFFQCAGFPSEFPFRSAPPPGQQDRVTPFIVANPRKWPIRIEARLDPSLPFFFSGQINSCHWQFFFLPPSTEIRVSDLHGTAPLAWEVPDAPHTIIAHG
ncbi:MAG: helix-turn-helix transcriptional regulator [Verrucomicrobiae bacterium]|nr:helix-turn-helix transcriptional regulator [Verrucomicrobiae bacterium]